MTEENHYLFTPFKRIIRWVSVEKRNIQFLYIYSIISGILSLAIPLGIQAMVGIILGIGLWLSTTRIGNQLFVLFGLVEDALTDTFIRC